MSSTLFPRLSRLGLIAVLAMTVLAACGSSDDDAETTSTSTSVLDDGTIETYEVDDDGEIIGTIPASDSGAGSTSGGGNDADGATGSDDSATSSGGDDSSSAGDAPAESADTDTDDDADAAAPSPADEEAPADAAEEAATAAPVTVNLTGQRCNGANLIVDLTARAGNGYRKGIRSVVAERQNEYGAWLDYAGSWLGPETGAGDVWHATLTGNRQNIGKTLRLTVSSDDGQRVVREYPITAPC